MTRPMIAAACTMLMIGSQAIADLMIPDSAAGDRIMLFSEADGSLIDASWITDIGAPYVFTTPKEAKVVGKVVGLAREASLNVVVRRCVKTVAPGF